MPSLADFEDADEDVNVDDSVVRPLPRVDEAVPVDEEHSRLDRLPN